MSETDPPMMTLAQACQVATLIETVPSWHVLMIQAFLPGFIVQASNGHVWIWIHEYPDLVNMSIREVINGTATYPIPLP